ncbi:hypothetical protein [Algoriphagus resistens]|uniref:hypothetical protein n=1 Tax=Algoriphagus resistens TaxID=1750590 RepID=UPI000716BD1E|nr:hypothetical protein [Algoriphagus resistens]
MLRLDAIPNTSKWSFFWLLLIIGGFSFYVLTAWSIDHIFNQERIDETGWIILGASIIRLITLGIVFMALRTYSTPVKRNTKLIALALFACSSGQLVYPLAELFVKLLVLVGLWESTGKGISNMQAEGWFNHGAAWLIFGIPGILFVRIGLQYSHSFRISRFYLFAGSVLGILLLLLIGVLIS